MSTSIEELAEGYRSISYEISISLYIRGSGRSRETTRRAKIGRPCATFSTCSVIRARAGPAQPTYSTSRVRSRSPVSTGDTRKPSSSVAGGNATSRKARANRHTCRDAKMRCIWMREIYFRQPELYGECNIATIFVGSLDIPPGIQIERL